MKITLRSVTTHNNPWVDPGTCGTTHGSTRTRVHPCWSLSRSRIPYLRKYVGLSASWCSFHFMHYRCRLSVCRLCRGRPACWFCVSQKANSNWWRAPSSKDESRKRRAREVSDQVVRMRGPIIRLTDFPEFAIKSWFLCKQSNMTITATNRSV